jgi:hypothetical protein
MTGCAQLGIVSERSKFEFEQQKKRIGQTPRQVATTLARPNCGRLTLRSLEMKELWAGVGGGTSHSVSLKSDFYKALRGERRLG